MLRFVLSCLAVALFVAADVSPGIAGDGTWAWPVESPHGGSPAVADAFDAPETDYGSGHRGVDLATLVGAPVRAVAGGTVTFAGRVAGVDAITIDHGAERSTYQPAAATVSVGDAVDAGDVIGKVVVGPFHCPTPCLHLGRVTQADDTYLDPLHRLDGETQIRLVDPHGPPPVPPAVSSR